MKTTINATTRLKSAQAAKLNLSGLDDGIYSTEDRNNCLVVSSGWVGSFEDSGDVDTLMESSPEETKKVLKFLAGKSGFLLAPYQHNYGYIFAKKPVLVVAGEWSDIPGNKAAFKAGKGLLIVGLGDD